MNASERIAAIARAVDARRCTFREERILFVPDVHWEFHDNRAWNCAMRVGKFYRPHRIVILGDFVDFCDVSAHSKDPARKLRLADEIRSVKRGFDQIDALGAERVDYCEGNHENRLSRYIARVAPELHGLHGLTAPELLGVRERGWTWHDYWTELCIGKLRVCHDYGEAGKRALADALDVTDTDTIIGHTHRIAEHVSRSRRTNQIIRGNSFGWLGSIRGINYQHKARALRFWGHACGVGRTRPDGSVRCEAVRFDRTLVVEGQRV